MTSGDTTRRPVVGQGPQRSVGRPTNWVMPPGQASHRPKDLLEGQWDPLSAKGQVDRPTSGPIYSQFTPTDLPHVWQCSNRPSKAVGRSVHPRVEKEGARGSLTWHPLSHPYIRRGPPPSQDISHLLALIFISKSYLGDQV